MLADDARYSMPPLPEWYQGQDEIRGFLLRGPLQKRWRFLPARANGQIAFGTYLWDDAAGAYIPAGLDVLTLLVGRVAHIVAFLTADLCPWTSDDLVAATSAPIARSWTPSTHGRAPATRIGWAGYLSIRLSRTRTGDLSAARGKMQSTVAPGHGQGVFGSHWNPQPPSAVAPRPAQLCVPGEGASICLAAQ
jgi:hypothetical protein